MDLLMLGQMYFRMHMHSVLDHVYVFIICSQVSIYEGDKRDCRKFCTTGIDGAMTIWDFKVDITHTHTRHEWSPLPLVLILSTK